MSVQEYFRTADLARILGLKPERLRAWVRSGLLQPVRDRRGQLLFGFRDAVEAHTIANLLEAGAQLKEIRTAVHRVQEKTAHEHPLAEVRFEVNRGRVLFSEGQSLGSADGQFSFDFQNPEAPEADARARAESFFAEGSAAAWERDDLETAEACFRKAVALDPTFADAWCDLGTVVCQVGDRAEARRIYLRALEVEPNHAEALCNLARMLLQDGVADVAADYLRRAIELVPDFALAHLHVGIAYEQLGQPERAANHLDRALAIDPDAYWAPEAQTALERLRELLPP